MAEKRMFAKSIVLSDTFLDMPMSARCLYFTLNMLADDDGFVGSPKAIMRQCGASEDDLKLLLIKRYVLAFDSGVIVIRHWRVNNYLQNDRKKETIYLEELAQIMVKPDKSYEWAENAENQPCIQNVYKMYTQNSIEENRLDKISSSSSDTGTKAIAEMTDETMRKIVETWNAVPHTVNLKFMTYGTARWNETRTVIDMFGLDSVLEAIQKINDSPYLKKRGKVVYDRYMNKNAIQNVLEGSYDTDFNGEEDVVAQIWGS